MRLSLVSLFLVKAVAGFVALLVVWYPLAKWAVVPVGLLAQGTVSAFFPAWAEGVEQNGVVLTLLTTLPVPGMAPGPEGQIAVFSPEVSFQKYGYGLPLFIALLLASGAKRFLVKAIVGGLLLVPCQVWGVCFEWLKQLAIEAGAAPFSPFGREIIAFGYQFGYLILPSVAPILLWAAMDRRFLAAFVMEATLEGVPAPESDPAKSKIS